VSIHGPKLKPRDRILTNSFAVQASLSQRVINAGIWSVGGFGVNLVIRFGAILLMTRLLTPDVFGVMAIASVIVSTLAIFSDLGLKQSVVQNNLGDDRAFLNTVWTIQILRGFQVGSSALAVALAIGSAAHYGLIPKDSVYADPRVPYIVVSVSLTAIIIGFTSTKLYEAGRRLMIGRATIIEIVAQIAGLVCMLSWVAIDRSIWALVGGSICSSAVTAVLSHYWLTGVSNRWEWDKLAFQDIMRFGKWMLASSIIGALISNSDRLLLGGMISATELGVYAIAFNIFLFTEQLLTRVVVGVAYPAISEIVRERPHDLRTAYYRVHRIIALLAYFCSGLLMASGHALIALLYDARYADAGWMLQILAVGLIAAPFQIASQTFMALGKPKLNTLILVLRLVTVIVAMPVGFRLFGLPGALIGFILSILICLPLFAILGAREGTFDTRRELLVVPAIFVGIGTGTLFNMLIAYLNQYY
jgi:O-antigen/teichoic acid export membrane protein